ncbi:unnamed protein product [Cylindrotheca closterium]|uniref:DUF6816 domain-containing protein n=1 Tax=Cylindrotheca closterium TaxID=2856 RepID=A0AAD2FSC3_9STRA|nr:unnamed protein product [Cylindrotheca closterium]
MSILFCIVSMLGMMACQCTGHQLRHQSRGLSRGYDSRLLLPTTKNHANHEPSCTIPRREFSSLLVGAAALSTSNAILGTLPAQAATGNLASKLSQRDPAALANSIFNIPPQTQVYPDFMHGTWKIKCNYAGFLFPSKKISREKLISNAQIPGFQKCSIVALSDIGKDSFDYTLSIDPTSGLEDRIQTLTTQVNSNLGYDAVAAVKYNAKSNPNRISIDFDEYRTINAERVELFANGRESEWIPETKTFVCSEYLRQVTFGTGSSVGIPRQVATNYAHFWTWKQDSEDPNVISGNLLTAAYLDPQDSMFFDEPSKPVAVYSHVLKGVKA